jgi:hypothetical protein
MRKTQGIMRSRGSGGYGMIRKNVQRFSEKIMPNQRAEAR